MDKRPEHGFYSLFCQHGGHREFSWREVAMTIYVTVPAFVTDSGFAL
jgi:hypothetical protein